MADVHRKIELQETDDLRYLINNTRRAANQKINDALPPIKGEDTLRQHVEELVHGYVKATFTAACENILINGHSPSPALVASLLTASSSGPAPGAQEYEPVNSKQHSRAAELAQKEEALLLEIMALKREAPAGAAEARRESQKAEIEREEEELMRALEAGEEGLDKPLLNVTKHERQEEVEKTWEKGVLGLARLKAEMPGTTARMERAKKTAEYVLAESQRSKRL